MRDRRRDPFLLCPARENYSALFRFGGLAVAGSLFGPRGITLIAVAIAAMVPLLNVLALGVLVRYAGGPKLDFIQMLRALFVNPFIWSPAIGLALNGTAVDLPQALLSYIDILGRASLAAGLLVVGVERPSTCVGWPSRRLSMCSRWL